MPDLSLIKWRVINLTTQIVADKINQVTGTHDNIVSGFCQTYDLSEFDTAPQEVLEDYIRQYAESIWGESSSG